ncbi:hypothetical protein ACH4LE_13600 [Streptomyces sp. NPDC017413]|uniref:hypothetical protein n=1 Tax=Streptomyces sp. NPDC017413 TaxID=3364994 RepID=UPI00379BDC19
MTDDELRAMLIPFRTRAVEEGYPWEDIDPLPAEEVDRWIGHVRPCAVLTGGGNGPVAGRNRTCPITHFPGFRTPTS